MMEEVIPSQDSVETDRPTLKGRRDTSWSKSDFSLTLFTFDEDVGSSEACVVSEDSSELDLFFFLYMKLSWRQSNTMTSLWQLRIFHHAVKCTNGSQQAEKRCTCFCV